MPERHAELTTFLTGLAMGESARWRNEVLVDTFGNAYVNSPNFDMSGGFDFDIGSRSGVVALVTPDGEARLVAGRVAFPNGMAVTAGNTTLIVAESFASRLSAWDIDADGSLSNRRVWATLRNGVDGICIDAEGAVWCATQQGRDRVREGGEVAQTISLDRFGFSCALGGPEGRTLFIVAGEWHGLENIGKGPGPARSVPSKSRCRRPRESGAYGQARAKTARAGSAGSRRKMFPGAEGTCGARPWSVHGRRPSVISSGGCGGSAR